MILNEEIKLSELQFQNFGDNSEIIFDIECFDETDSYGGFGYLSITETGNIYCFIKAVDYVNKRMSEPRLTFDYQSHSFCLDTNSYESESNREIQLIIDSLPLQIIRLITDKNYRETTFQACRSKHSLH
ncbi:hypothetical protein BCU69_22290 [Vibrio cyclitrophicus]|uniref:hypothetical protein n=1 Tax=Vibrio cyclitrophicus TaxID=47951 RepID=UPI000C850D8C|nr:hypothetical protein [Vibrio cyclitrophicus]PMH34492.1 hypothetical protein BCU69_22290 [Vibrio cyclitrophicus]